MIAQVKAWGNGQGIRFSKEFLDSLEICVDEYLDVTVRNGSIILTKTFKHKTLEERAAEFDGKIEPYEEFPWGEAVGRECW